MDLATPLGMAVAVAALVVSILMEGGTLRQLWNTSALLLVVGGTLGFTVTTFRTKEVAALPKALLRAFFPPADDRAALAQEMVRMAELARREGLLVLQNMIASLPHPLLRRGLNLALDGVDPQVVRDLLEQETALQRRRIEAMAAVLEQAGGYAPTVGIIGTVMGLVHVLGNLSDTEHLGPAIAAAFMATFYGIFTANFLWLPLATKLKAQAERFEETARMIVVGVLGIYTGETPSRLRDKLATFLDEEPASPEAAPVGPEPGPVQPAEAAPSGSGGGRGRTFEARRKGG